MKLQAYVAVGVAVVLSACAGRAPAPVPVVQAQDRYMDCAAISAEVQANNKKIIELGGEEGAKVAQNVAAGVAGLFIWPLWFAMDFQGAAPKEVAALQARQQYLATLAEQRCGAAPPLPVQTVPQQTTTTGTGAVSPVPSAATTVAPSPGGGAYTSTPTSSEPASPQGGELSCINPDGSFLRTTAPNCPPPSQPLRL
jgi:hypothetical protein